VRIPQAVLDHFNRQDAAEKERRRKYGNVRPIISTDFGGRKVVAVGNTVFWDENWRTFPDFLFDYIKTVLGSDWGNAELAKPPARRHPILQWYEHVVQLRTGQAPDESALYPAASDGIAAAYLLLAYDLYVLRHHDKLQKEALKRLRHPDQFTGARYELFVAATFIRAGFEIDYEDETDSTRKHPEFLATHSSKHLTIAVEAKARHRDVNEAVGKEVVLPGVKRLLRDAAAKRTANPFAVFVELALPPEPASSKPSWTEHVKRELSDVTAELGGHSPFDLVMFTNRPHQYGDPGEPDPRKHFYAVWPLQSRIPEDVVGALGEAAKQYGNVPNDFPADFDAVAAEGR